MSESKKNSMWATYKPFMRRYIMPQKYILGLGVFFGIIAAASAGFGLPVMIQYVFPVVFGEQPIPAWLREWVEIYMPGVDTESATMWLAASAIPLIMAIRGFSTYLNILLLTKAGMNALTDLRTDVFARLQWLSFSYHDRNTRGGLMTSIIQFTQMVQQGMVTIMNDLVIQPLTLLAAVAYLVYAALSHEASAILMGNLLITAACVPLVRFVGKRMVKQMQKSLSGIQVITSTIEETLSAQREVRAFNLQERQESRLKTYIQGYNRLLIKMAIWRQSLTPAIEIVSAFALSYSLYRGCSDGLTLEQFTAIAMAFYFCYDPIKKLGSVTNQAQITMVAVNGLNEILNAKDETPEPKPPAALPSPVQGAVDFEKVSFGYEAGKPVLKNVDVHVPAGQIVALVGPSGSGKTTFINLICRFYDAQKGAVKIDGIDVRRLSRADRTRNIGLVSQFSALFRDSIRENIRIGRPEANNAEVLEAARHAHVDEFVQSFPEGYDRMLGEGGGGLSGGQRQRVSIARAFLKNAPILILDEATSALDMKSEAAIQASLDELAQGHTTFIIAHRFSTIRMAQRILVFEEGRIIADGTHDELYEQCVLYRGLYDEQVRQTQEEKEETV